jgi:DNA-binding NarL/FixJ family response regulator
MAGQRPKRRPMETGKKRVMIVDDHPLFRERLAQLINHEPDMQVCGEAEDAEKAIQVIRDVFPDLVIIDITLKGSSGLELVKTIKALSIGVPMLVLSMHDESLYAQRALRAGATGYITKHRAADDVLSAMRRVLSGEVYLSERMTSQVLKSFASAGSKGGSRPIDRLTDRELEVLTLIGNGSTSRQIAHALNLGLATVDTYRTRIKEKLNFSSATELQHFAVRWVRERE